MPPKAAPPIEPLNCSATGCGYSTPEGVPDFGAQLTCLSLHTQQAHPAPAPAGVDQAQRVAQHVRWTNGPGPLFPLRCPNMIGASF